MKKQFCTPDICKLLCISRSLLRDLAFAGVITPSIRQAKGQGDKSVYSIDDLKRLILFRVLQKNGFQAKGAKEALDVVWPKISRNRNIQFLAWGRIGDKLEVEYIEDGIKQFENLINKWEYFFLVNLSFLKELEEDIESGEMQRLWR